MKLFLNYGHIIVLTLIILLGILALYHSNIITPKTYTAKDFQIERVLSPLDKDEDGIDDYTDILQGAQAFVAKKPKYQSKYYQGGYPTDNYYVCTDVIWYALKTAGYNLKDLMDADIKDNYSDYNIETPDPNIDFRRVRNIKVYLDKYTEKLTTDVSSIERWQPGDIVVYADHIAIISDKRNKDGVPYIIHHAPNLIKYEENKLTKKEIVGHYRFNLQAE